MSNFRTGPTRVKGCARASVSAFSVLIAGACTALAQTQPADLSASTVVVTAARTEQAQTDALPHTTVLTSDDIRSSQAVDLPTLLKREAGVQFTQNGGVGQASGLFVRGAETRQTLILLDGVPLTKQDATGTVSVEHLMLDEVDRIEIVRGDVSSIYGSGAIGGVIQIFTRRGNGPAHASVSAEAGSRGTARLAASVSGSAGDTRYALAASHFKTDGFSSLNHDQLPGANPDRDGYDNNSVSASLSHEFAKDQEFGVRLSSASGKFDFDSSFGAPTDIHKGKTDVDTASAFANNRLAANWMSRLQYSESRDRNANHYESGFGDTDDNYRSKTRILQWNNEFSLAPGWRANAGVERQWQSFSSDDGYGGVFAADRNADSVFAGVQGRSGPHQIQFNLRHDRFEHLESATTAFLGYGYDVTDALKATASVSSGFSAPPLGYLYAPFFGNPNLKPEHARSAEAGLQYAASGALLRAVLFATRAREEFLYDPVTSRFENIAKASNRGLELSASGKCQPIGVDLRASLTLQDPRDDSTDQRLRRRARTLASLAASKSIGAWQLGGDLGYTGDRPDGSHDLGAYWVANLNARYALAPGLSLTGRVDNLFDRNYQTAYGYNQPPRGVFVGLNWQP